MTHFSVEEEDEWLKSFKALTYEAPQNLLDLSEMNTTQDTTGLQSFNVTIRSRYGAAMSYPRDLMTMVWKRVKRSGHQAAKYGFVVSFKELVIDAERKPEKIQISLMHRRRRYSCDARPLEKSFSSDNRYMIVWPDLAADSLNFNTTLFKNPNKEQFDNKEWTLIAEEITKKGKTRPLAAVQLNFSFFVNQNPDVKTELKLKLRCLQKDVNNCTLSMILSSTLVKEGQAIDDDIQSQASVSSAKIPIDIPLNEENEKITEDFEDWNQEKEISEGVKKITKDFEEWKEKEEILVEPTPPPQIKQAWGEPPAEETRDERRQSGNEPLPVVERRHVRTKEPRAIERRQSRDEEQAPLPAYYELSETEKNVMRDLQRMRLLRGEDEIDRAEPMKSDVPVNISERSHTTKLQSTSHAEDENDDPKPFGRSRRDSIKELDDHQLELQRMVDEMKDLAAKATRESLSPKSPPAPAPLEQKYHDPHIYSELEQRERRKQEAKKLVEQLHNTSGDAITISSMLQKHPQRGGNGHQRHGSDLSANAYSMNNPYSTNPRDAPPDLQPSAFDRVKRYGSMRGVELAETLSQYISPIMDSSSRSQQPYDNSLNATPTRKIITSFEKNVINVEDINEELQKIMDRIKEVENLDRHVEERIRSVEAGSEDEQKYLTEHMKLLNEKDALVRKQDYFNVAAEMSEIEEQLAIVQQQVNEVTTNNDIDKTEEEKQRIDNLVEEYKSLIDKKNELAEVLIQKEAEEEEHDERGRRTLERSQNFLRGSQEPLNTSRRIINWIKSTTS